MFFCPINNNVMNPHPISQESSAVLPSMGWNFQAWCTFECDDIQSEMRNWVLMEDTYRNVTDCMWSSASATMLPVAVFCPVWFGADSL